MKADPGSDPVDVTPAGFNVRSTAHEYGGGAYCIHGETAFFSNFGVAYTARLIDVPASTGYGEPIQKLFKLRDGELNDRALRLERLLDDLLGGAHDLKLGRAGL